MATSCTKTAFRNNRMPTSDQTLPVIDILLSSIKTNVSILKRYSTITFKEKVLNYKKRKVSWDHERYFKNQIHFSHQTWALCCCCFFWVSLCSPKGAVSPHNPPASVLVLSAWATILGEMISYLGVRSGKLYEINSVTFEKEMGVLTLGQIPRKQHHPWLLWAITHCHRASG